MKHLILALGAWLTILPQVIGQNQYTKQELEQMAQNTSSTNDEGFHFFNNNRATINNIMGGRYAENQLMYWIYKTDIESLVETKDAQPQWKKMKKKITKQYGEIGEEIILKAKFTYFLNKKDWSSFVASVDPYIKKYGENLFPFELNNYAWKIFEEVSDKKLLQKALNWSEISIAHKKPDPAIFLDRAAYYDTYANLLYKTGQTEKALDAEQKAINITSNANEKTNYQRILDKMKKGEKTWP